MIRGGRQEETLREFCRTKGYEQHEAWQLFRRNQHEPWILYRRGTKHPQKMGAKKEVFPGWTFSKSLGTPEERRLYKSVCLHAVAYGGIEEAVWYARKDVFEKCARKVKAKRLYLAWNPDRIFDPERRSLVERLRPNPVFSK